MPKLTNKAIQTELQKSFANFTAFSKKKYSSNAVYCLEYTIRSFLGQLGYYLYLSWNAISKKEFLKIEFEIIFTEKSRNLYQTKIFT